jgi:acetate kinase
MSGQILVINSGSSSLKFGVYEQQDEHELLILNGSIDSLGSSGGKFKLKDAAGKVLQENSSQAKSQNDAFTTAMKALEQHGLHNPVAVGHRVVHGGPTLRQHQRITPEVLDTLKQAAHFAPLHDPPAIAMIETAQKHFANTPQFACFDTAFHRTIPEIAAHYPLPLIYWQQGVQRYGFHGLSYESIVRKLGSELKPRTVVAHLGNGASLAAILDGKSVDTSMGLTPTGGIPMGTRSGDLDPSIILWLLRNGLDVDAAESLLNHDSGLKGLSNGESDLRALTKSAEEDSAPAILALDVFCRSIAKTIASYAVSLGGLDMLIFTGGIGENSALVRERVCDQLAFLGVDIDREKNSAGETRLSNSGSSINVHVVPTDEDGEIALHTRALLNV